MKKNFVQGLAIATFAVFGAASGAMAQRNPVGEKCDYQLDRNAQRTSNLIQSGSLAAEITMRKPDAEGGPAYETKIDYMFRITLIGNRSGTEYVDAPESFFTEEFLQELRRTGHFESPQFKIDHQGFADATTLDGHRFPNCDKLKIYDIDQGDRSALVEFARAMVRNSVAEENLTTEETIEDLVLHAHVFYGVPVLGAVKLDVSGKYSGINIKAGADYKTP